MYISWAHYWGCSPVLITTWFPGIILARVRTVPDTVAAVATGGAGGAGCTGCRGWGTASISKPQRLIEVIESISIILMSSISPIYIFNHFYQPNPAPVSFFPHLNFLTCSQFWAHNTHCMDSGDFYGDLRACWGYYNGDKGVFLMRNRPGSW